MTESEWLDFMVFELDEAGEKTRLNINKEDLGDYLKLESVFLIIYQDVKRIYLWKGARSPVRKRFLGSRTATSVQGDIMKDGLKRCKIVAVDQGDEVEEFLNMFGLESMEVKEEDRPEDKRYVRNIEKEEKRIAEIKGTKLAETEGSKLNEIKNLLKGDEKIAWLRSDTIHLTDNWLKVLLKDKKYRGRLKSTKEAKEIEIKSHEIRYVITNKRIITNHLYNKLYNYSNIPKYALELNGEIALLDLRELRGFEIEDNHGTYDVWFHSNPEKKGDNVFLFEGLTSDEYRKFVDVVSVDFYAKIPEKLRKLSYIRMKK
jgi:hypothetical protein